MTYGWILLIVAIVGSTLITTLQNYDAREIPDNFSLSESRQAVSQSMLGTCTNIRNQSDDDHIYYFECSQNHGNYTYIAEVHVKYNESGKDQVYVFN